MGDEENYIVEYAKGYARFDNKTMSWYQTEAEARLHQQKHEAQMKYAAEVMEKERETRLREAMEERWEVTTNAWKEVKLALDFEPEVIYEIHNVKDIVELSIAIRSGCAHGHWMRYERQQNRLTLMLEKDSDRVLIKMFMAG